uniref:Putative RNA-directed DNA polymerase n=1 Tax=Schizaphis graminum TaxID=13262 RepID=A0A2S2N7M6_SCHGA
MDVPHQLINILRSFLQDRTFKVKIGDILSASRKISAGVPQGSCLSPHLFSIYINDMPLDKEANIALFAEDTVFYATGATNNAAIKRVQRQIDLAVLWFKQWKITLNPSKTKAIMFSNKPLYQAKTLHFENTQIKWSNTVKYLGVTIDSKLNFVNHIKTTLHKASEAKFSLFPLINKFSPLPLKTKLYISNMYIRPIIMYASPVWSSNLSNSSWQKLETFQSKVLRLLTGSDWYVSNHTIRSSLNMLSIKDTVNKEKNATTQKIQNSNYDHISFIFNRKSHKELFKKRPLSI